MKDERSEAYTCMGEMRNLYTVEDLGADGIHIFTQANH
jgi:hypothetical protein